MCQLSVHGQQTNLVSLLAVWPAVLLKALRDLVMMLSHMLMMRPEFIMPLLELDKTTFQLVLCLNVQHA